MPEVIDLAKLGPEGEEPQEFERGGVRELAFKTLYSRPDILGAACGIFDRTAYFEDDPVCALPWKLVSEYYRDYGDLPSREFLERDIRKMHPSWSCRRLTAPLDDLFRLLRVASAKRPGKADLDIVRSSLKERLHGKAREMIDAADDVQAVLPEVERLLSMDPFRKRGQVYLGGTLDEFLDRMRQNPRNTMDMRFLDFMLAGGMRMGETLGLVVPSGGGKTTLAFQMAVEKALVGKHTLVILLEGFFDQDMDERVVVLASGVPRDRVREVVDGRSEFDEREREQFETGMRMISKYVHFVDDFAGTDAKASCYRDIVMHAVETATTDERNPLPKDEIDTVVIDWWGLVATKIAQPSSGPLRGDVDRRHWMMSSKQQIKTVSQELNCRTVVLHQPAGKSVPGGGASSYHAQEDSNFNNLFDFCMGASQADLSDNTFTLVMDKSRGAAKCSLSMLMDGQTGKWRINDIVERPPDASPSDAAMEDLERFS